jgi:PmbA protein
MGVQMGNVNGGEVTGNIELGYLIENGEIAGRVKDAMISLNIMDALKDIVLSEETIWTDFLLSPYILIPNASISTKS